MKKSFLLLFIFSASIFVNASQDDDTLMNMEQEPEHKVITMIKTFAQEHKWCLAAIAACLGFAYLQQATPSRSGSFAELHAQIDELEGALLKYKMIYPFIKDMLESKGIVINV